MRFLYPVVVALSLALRLGAAEPPASRGAPYSIEVISAEAGAARPSRPTLMLFDGTTNRLAGWSHIVTNPERFPHARFAPADYAVDASCVGTDAGSRVFRTILLKKLGDWDQQHINGIEPRFDDAAPALGDVRQIVLELKIDAARSRLASVAELAALYGDRLTPAQLASLDNGRAHLGISLFEAGFNAHDGTALHATVYVEFDPAKDFDRWLRVTIPVREMDFYFEKNYAHTPAVYRDHLARRLVGLRINPETRTSLVARNFLLERFDAQVPERYQEIAVALRRLELVRRD